MDAYNKYAASADTIKIEDITSCEVRRDILRMIKENDLDITALNICDDIFGVNTSTDFTPLNADELAWLGYFLGQNTNIEALTFSTTLPTSCHDGIEVFRIGLGHNNSIYKINFFSIAADGRLFSMLDEFIKNNNHLKEMGVVECIFGDDAIRQLSLLIGVCCQSLKCINISNNTLLDGSAVDIITSLSMHSQLEQLRFIQMNVGRNECSALSTLLRHTTTNLQILNLDKNDINDEGVEVLVQALSTNGNKLQDLDLGSNRSVTSRGWKMLANLLANPGCQLENVYIDCNNIGDEEALVFANSLTNNSTLKTLDLTDNIMTPEGWEPFSKLLCDKSSVSKTYLANHTLTA